MFKKILIANRGEIAVRIIRACKELGVATVAVYSDADRKSLHVSMADEAYHIGPPAPGESYLVMDKIMDVAKRSGAEAIHPGYGFLSENPAFAEICEKEGIVFIGPSSDAIRKMGDKITARKIAKRIKVPLVSGSDGAVTDVEAESYAMKIGFPVMIKASAGGGGKGMRMVEKVSNFTAALRMARSEAHRSFGDDSVYIEKFVVEPRHIEIQLICDSHGKILHLFERECSVQRRHQKVVEEAPSGYISAKTRKKMAKVATKIAKAVNYRGAGTVEFIMDQDENFYFLEMNTRVQVEHPVTEMITGFDIVKWMIRIASGEKLPFKQRHLTMNGHSIECRIYAEVPEQNFMPSPGKVTYIKSPSGPGIRDDSSVYSGCEVTPHYDPMLSKLIVWAESRRAAIDKMREALGEYVILGVKNNIGFLIRLLEDEDFIDCKLDTGFIDKHPELLKSKSAEVKSAIIAAALGQQDASKVVDSEEFKAVSSWNAFARRAAVSRNSML